VFSALEVYYDNAPYKFTFDIDVDIGLPYEITQCYLPPGTSEHTPP